MATKQIKDEPAAGSAALTDKLLAQTAGGTTQFETISQLWTLLQTQNPTWAQQAVATGLATLMTFTGAAHTGLTAGAENVDINVNLARTVTWAPGAITTQRFGLFQAPTIAFSSGSNTVTNTATVAITNAPQAGANATLTNAMALWVQAGKTQLDGLTEILTGRFNGNAPPSTGVGVEVLYNSPNGIVRAYDRTGAVYKPLLLMGQTVFIQPNGNTSATFDSTGRILFGTAGSYADPGSSSGVLYYDSTGGKVTIAGYSSGGNSQVALRTAVGSGSNADRFLISSTGAFQVSPAAATTAAPIQWSFTTAADTGITATAESNVAKWGGATRTWADGTVALQRDHYFRLNTLAKTTTSATFTDAATLAVEGVPAAGAGVTITKAWAQVWGTPAATTTAQGANQIGLFGGPTVQFVLRDTTNSVEGLVVAQSGAVQFGSATNTTVQFLVNNGIKLALAGTTLTHTPAASSSGIAANFIITPSADTGVTANGEKNVFRMDGATKTWADGTTTLQRDFYVRSMTYNKTTSAATFTDAATLAVEGVPAAGSGVTITRPWSILSGTPSAISTTLGANQIGLFGAGAVYYVARNTTNSVEGAFGVTTSTVFFGSATSHDLILSVGGNNRLRCYNAGDVVLNPSGSALATNATAGFTHLPSTTNTPTGVPGTLVTGAVPVQIDTGNSKLWAYIGGAWKSVTFT